MTISIVHSIDPQTQQFVDRSLETLKSFLMLYTSADVQAVMNLAVRAEQLQVKLDRVQQRLGQVDSHLQQQKESV
jgi:hypothetical protein